MMTIEEAKLIIEEVTQPLGVTVKRFDEALFHTLADDVLSKVFMPPFNRSAMDGFACRKKDLPGPLKVIDNIPAGGFSSQIVQSGDCARIMTGAPVPDGADTVIMLEHVEVRADQSILFVKDKTNTNISLKGEDLKPGDLLLPRGMLLKSHHIAILAGAGVDTVKVHAQPRVGIISTGSELIEPGSEQQPGMIFNSNGHQLLTRLNELGLSGHYYGIGQDDYESLKELIHQATEEQDVLLITGGVSVGDYDFVPAIFKALGFDIHISKVAAKPGKHTLFASKNGKYVLGLPGNPVSTYVQFEECGRLLINRLMGSTYRPLRLKTKMAEDYQRKRSDRFELLPVKINGEGCVERLSYHGSAHMHVLSAADALLEIPIGTSQFLTHQEVYVRPL